MCDKANISLFFGENNSEKPEETRGCHRTCRKIPQIGQIIYKCREQESNLHTLRYMALNHARLPFRHPGLLPADYIKVGDLYIVA